MSSHGQNKKSAFLQVLQAQKKMTLLNSDCEGPRGSVCQQEKWRRAHFRLRGAEDLCDTKAVSQTLVTVLFLPSKGT